MHNYPQIIQRQSVINKYNISNMNTFLLKLKTGIAVMGILIASIFGVTHVNAPKTSAAPQFTSGKPYTLYGSGISSTDTSVRLTSFKQPVSDTPWVTADLIGGVGNYFYLTIEPSTDRKEFLGCTGVTQNSDGTAYVTGCVRGLSFAYPYTASTTLRLSHSGGSRVVLSNSPQLYNDIITYINGISIAGVNDGSATVKGIFEKATGSEAASHAAIGSGNTTAPLVLTTDIASSTRSANVQQVIISSSTGYIDSSFLNGVVTTSGNNTFTGTNTFSTSTTATTTIGSFPAWEIGKQQVTFTSGSGNFTVPSGITKLNVTICAGGGNGGGSTSSGSSVSAAGGGGSGGCAFKMFDTSATTSIAYSVGAAVANSSFGTIFTTAGATASSQAGSGGSTAGGAGGTASGGDLNITGTNGGGGSGGSTGNGLGGQGASCPFGGGGGGGLVNGSTGSAGGYCAGGGGGAATSGGGGGSAGNGAPGFIRITW
jgi:hypothetical protein